MSDVLALIDKAIEAGEDIYDLAVNIGMQDVEDVDERIWRIGDVAARLTKVYGTNVTGRYAKDIGEVAKRVGAWKTTSTVWTNSIRAEIGNPPGLHRSHFVKTQSLARKNMRAARKLLNLALKKDWSVEKVGVIATKAIGKPVKQSKKTVLSASGVIQRLYNQQDGYYAVIRFAEPLTADFLQAQRAREPVQFTGTVAYRAEAVAS